MRVVYVIPVLRKGGTERFLINLLSGLPQDYHSSIVCYDDKNEWYKELKKMDVDVTVIDKPSKAGILKNLKELIRYFKVVRPDVVCAYTSYNAANVLLAAKICGVKVRIAHAHTSATEHKKTIGYKTYTVISRILLSAVATDKLACSDTAGKSMYYGKYQIIKNGIDLKKYSYSEAFRNEIRKKMKIDSDTILLGTVGRLDDNKNQLFMLKIISELRDKDIKLLIVGDGPNKEKLLTSAKEMGIDEKVIFAGAVEDTYKYYSAFDIFLLTSYNEGAPFVLIEAQANGVPIVASSSIDCKIKVNDNVNFLDLSIGCKHWLEIINAMCLSHDRPNTHINEYSVENTTQKIMSLYGEDRT